MLLLKINLSSLSGWLVPLLQGPLIHSQQLVRFILSKIYTKLNFIVFGDLINTFSIWEIQKLPGFPDSERVTTAFLTSQ